MLQPALQRRKQHVWCLHLLGRTKKTFAMHANRSHTVFCHFLMADIFQTWPAFTTQMSRHVPRRLIESLPKRKWATWQMAGQLPHVGHDTTVMELSRVGNPLTVPYLKELFSLKNPILVTTMTKLVTLPLTHSNSHSFPLIWLHPWFVVVNIKLVLTLIY